LSQQATAAGSPKLKFADKLPGEDQGDRRNQAVLNSRKAIIVAQNP
jgi:hypothetical protein